MKFIRMYGDEKYELRTIIYLFLTLFIFNLAWTGLYKTDLYFRLKYEKCGMNDHVCTNQIVEKISESLDKDFLFRLTSNWSSLMNKHELNGCNAMVTADWLYFMINQGVM